MIEIERKFLVVGEDWKENSEAVRICQGYLCIDEERTVRVRYTEDQSWITVKGREEGRGRPEFEYVIPGDEAQELLETLCLPPLLDKTRYTLNHEGKEWVVDEFRGENDGLVLAEIELEYVGEEVKLPPWIDREVTGDARYYNSRLSEHPYTSWK